MVVTLQVKTFVKEAGWLGEIEAGFYSGYNTKWALLAAIDNLTFWEDAGGTGALILLDLLASFDTVVHDEILLNRFYGRGLQGMDFIFFDDLKANRASSTLRLSCEKYHLQVP